MYPYFVHYDATEEDIKEQEKFERENFPNEELWEKACERCAPWSVNDFNVAASRYRDLVRGEEITCLILTTNLFNF